MGASTDNVYLFGGHKYHGLKASAYWKAQGGEDGGRWVTINGNPVFIEDRESKGRSLSYVSSVGDTKIWVSRKSDDLTPLGEVRPDSSTDIMVKQVSRVLSETPLKQRNLISHVEVEIGGGKEFTAGGQNFKEGAHWDATDNTVRVFQVPRGEEDAKRLISHEIGHAVWSDTGKRYDKFSKDWNEDTERVTKDMESKGIPWFGKSPSREYEGKTINQYLITTRDAQRDAAMRKGGFNAYFDFQEASGKEGGVTGYAKAWLKEGHVSENFAEMHYLDTMRYYYGDSPQSMEKTRTYKAYKGVVGFYGGGK